MKRPHGYRCQECNAELPDSYKPALCCSGWECACQGQPTNPPICSQECWDKMLAGIGAAPNGNSGEGPSSRRQENGAQSRSGSPE